MKSGFEPNQITIRNRTVINLRKENKPVAREKERERGKRKDDTREGG